MVEIIFARMADERRPLYRVIRKSQPSNIISARYRVLKNRRIRYWGGVLRNGLTSSQLGIDRVRTHNGPSGLFLAVILLAHS